MTEYIEREALLYEFREIMPEMGENEVADDMYGIAYNFPADYSSKIVHCKDCKHYYKRSSWCKIHSHIKDDLDIEWNMFDDDDYCSYGERKGG